MRQKASFWWIAAFVFFLIDRIVKIIFVEGYLGEIRLSDWLSLHTVYNKGVAFGLGYDWGFLISFLGLLLFSYFIFLNIKYWVEDVYSNAAVGIVLSGAISNLVDRLWYNGRVVDYIDVSFYSVFNLADVAIVIGLVIFGIRMWNSGND